MYKYTINDVPANGALEGAHIAASNYYGGQFTALYALLSTGSLELYPGEGLERIRDEVSDAHFTAVCYYPEDVIPLGDFLEWINAELALGTPAH